MQKHFFGDFCDTWSEKVERKIQFQVTLEELPKAENTFSHFRELTIVHIEEQ